MAALVVALALTVPIALIGALAGVVGAAWEGWLILVGRLADSVGWLPARGEAQRFLDLTRAVTTLTTTRRLLGEE